MSLHWRSFPLAPAPSPERPAFSQHSLEEWTRASELGEGVKYKIRDLGAPGPLGSMPALEAARCALLQGEEAGERFHRRAMAAYFEEGLDISDRKVLASLVRQAGLDLPRFRADLKSGAPREEVLKEHLEGLALGIDSIPTVIFADQNGILKVVGDVPLAQYRRVFNYLAAS